MTATDTANVTANSQPVPSITKINKSHAAYFDTHIQTHT